jgi:hypothetical protein
MESEQQPEQEIPLSSNQHSPDTAVFHEFLHSSPQIALPISHRDSLGEVHWSVRMVPAVLVDAGQRSHQTGMSTLPQMHLFVWMTQVFAQLKQQLQLFHLLPLPPRPA